MRSFFTGVYFILLITQVAFGGIIYVDATNGSDSGDGSIGAPYKTFHKAYSMAVDGDVIHLSGTFTWTDADETGDVATDGYVIDKDLTIEGDGVDNTIIQAAATENTADRCVFTVNAGRTVSFNNLTIRYGKASTMLKGGGITSNGAALTLNMVRLTGNRFDNSSYSNGAGALYGGYDWNTNHTKLNMTNCTVDNNYCDIRLYGAGGVWLEYVDVTEGVLIQNCTFTKNKAYSSLATTYPYDYSSPAGALGVRDTYGTTGPASGLKIVNNTFTENYSDCYAGACNLGKHYPPIFFVNNTVVNNTAELGAAGVLHSNNLFGRLYIKNNILANNIVNSTSAFNDLYINSDATGKLYTEGYNIVENSYNFTPAPTDLTGEQTNLNISSTLADNNTQNGTQTLALQAGSVAINAGDNADIVYSYYTFSVPTTDQRGKPRVVGKVDIGAYETSYPSATQPAGSGSLAEPYLISTLSELYWIAEQNENGNEFDGVYFQQTANIDAAETQYWFEGEGWKPIGSFSIRFKGNYNGQGHVIENLYINLPSTDHVGLFGFLYSPEVSNLTLSNVNITGKDYVGGLCGQIYLGENISNCSVSGIVNGSSYTGGLIGEADNSSSVISNCFSSATVNSTGGLYVGGLAGAANQAVIQKCYATGSVTGNDYVGGLIGYNYGSIENCYSSGSVVSGGKAGGLVGWNRKVISNCYAVGTVSASGYDAGGLVGHMVDNFAAVNNAFWNTDIVSNGVGYYFAGDITTLYGKTTSEMKDHTNFLAAGWDFVLESANGTDDIWDMDYSGAINNGYPYLSWQDGEDNSLPVELASFSAVLVNGGVKLIWVTESELDNAGFILQRSADQSNWTTIASYENNEELKGQGNSNARTTYSFVDYYVTPGTTWYYRLADVSTSGVITYHHPLAVSVPYDPNQPNNNLPLTTKMENAYPNPFNPETYIAYSLAEDCEAQIMVYDLLGRKVQTLHNGFQKAGRYHVYWQGKNELGQRVPSGIYIIRLKTDLKVQSQKVMLVK